MNLKKLNLREVNIDDQKLIFNWSNEKEVRLNSINKEKIKYKDHKIWFQKKILEKKTIFWIFEYNKVPCGQIRFDMDNKKNDKLSYMIEKNYRGKKFGKKMLDMAIIKKGKIRKNNIYAFSLKNNLNSSNTLKLSGFVLKKEYNDKFLYIYKY